MATVKSNGAISSNKLNMRDLESKGMTSVYLDGKFIWQLPKALLEQRASITNLKTSSDGEDATLVDLPTTWEITGCTRDALRVFSDWLYSSNGQLKARSPGVPMKAYLEAIKFALAYDIPPFLQCLVSLVMDTLGDTDSGISSEDLDQAMGSGSSGSAIISGNLAVMLQHGMLDPTKFKMIIKTPGIARDVLVWLELFRQNNIANFDQETKLKWATENISKWSEIQQ